MYLPQEVAWIQMLVKKYFRDAQWLWIQFFRVIAYNSTRLSFQSCNYGAFIDPCPYSPWATCLHRRRMCYTSGFTETLLQFYDHINCSDEDDQNDVFQTPVPHYQLAS